MEQVIQTKTGMTVKIIPKQASHSALSNNGTELRYISTDKNTWEDDEITEDVISYFLKQIPLGIEAYLSPVPFGEDDWLEVICNQEWLALAYSSDDGQHNFYSYNPDYKGVEEWSPLNSGGQSPVEKYLALTDIKAGVQAVEFFIRTGKLYPGINWAQQL